METQKNKIGGKLGWFTGKRIVWLVGLGLVLFAQPIVQLLYGHEYDDSILPLRLLGAMTVLYGINYYAATMLTARDRPTSFTRVATIVAVVNIGVNLVLIPRYVAFERLVFPDDLDVLRGALDLRRRSRDGPPSSQTAEPGGVELEP